MSVNKVILIGNLGADPEIRNFENGSMIATVSIATSERWTDKQTGERREHTEWHRVVFNNRLAEIAKQWLRKGSQIYVEGSLRTRKWQDPQTGQERYSTEIRADNMQMLGNRNTQDGGGFSNYNQHQNQVGQPNQGYNQSPNYQAGRPNQAAYQQPYNQGYAQPNPDFNQNQFANNQPSFGGPSGYPQDNFAPNNYTQPTAQPAAQQNDMAQNNSFGVPAQQNVNQPAKPVVANPASQAVITPTEVTDDDIPF